MIPTSRFRSITSDPDDFTEEERGIITLTWAFIEKYRECLETQIEAYCLDELLQTDDTHNKSVALALLLRADNMHFWDDGGLRAGLRNPGNFFA